MKPPVPFEQLDSFEPFDTFEPLVPFVPLAPWLRKKAFNNVRNCVSSHKTIIYVQFARNSETANICRSMLFQTAKRLISCLFAQLCLAPGGSGGSGGRPVPLVPLVPLVPFPPA